jgi:hypothetical protein
MSKLQKVVDEIDEDAFIIKHSVDDVVEGKVKHRAMHYQLYDFFQTRLTPTKRFW